MPPLPNNRTSLRRLTLLSLLSLLSLGAIAAGCDGCPVRHEHEGRVIDNDGGAYYFGLNDTDHARLPISLRAVSSRAPLEITIVATTKCIQRSTSLYSAGDAARINFTSRNAIPAAAAAASANSRLARASREYSHMRNCWAASVRQVALAIE